MGQLRRMLTLEDRESISRGIAEELTGKEIAERIGRDPGVVSREIYRNGGRGFYRAARAQKDAARRRRRPKARKLAKEGPLRAEVIRGLKKRRSPRQVAGRLPLDFPQDGSMRVSHEGIYSWIFALPVGELAKLGVRLRSGRTRRSPYQHRAKAAPKIRDIRWIDDRPAEAEGRQVPGHWEGDLVIGKNGGSALASVVERQSRLTLLVPLAGKDSKTVTNAIALRIQGLPDKVRRTLTWDCGTEMADHAALSLAADIDVYFAHPHSPWERGTNEHTNRWIREYFPKGTVIPNDARILAEAEDELNDRPRAIFGFRTPREVFAELLTRSIASSP